MSVTLRFVLGLRSSGQPARFACDIVDDAIAWRQRAINDAYNQQQWQRSQQ